MSRTAARALLVAAAGLVLCGVAPSPARAQGPSGESARAEIGAGVLLAGPMDLGSASANLTQPNGNAFPLFQTSSRIGMARGAEITGGVRLGRALAVEGAAGWSRADLETKVSADADGGADATLTDTLARFSAEGAVLWTVKQAGAAGFFVRGSVGWMSELAGDGAYNVRGTIGSAGFGMKYWFGRSAGGARDRGFGLRVEGRALARSKGVALSSRRTVIVPAVTGGIVYGF